MALKKEQVRYTADLASDGEVIRGYLNGGTFSYEGEKGWYLIMADGFSSGWGKLAGGIMKNHYPKGLRKMWQCENEIFVGAECHCAGWNADRTAYGSKINEMALWREILNVIITITSAF